MIDEPQTQTIWNEACAASLAGLAGMGPRRLAALLADLSPDAAWAAIAEGADLSASVKETCGGAYFRIREIWRRRAKTLDPLDELDRYRKLGISIWTPFTSYPARLTNDPWAPAVLFGQGNRAALDRTTVAIIGTRRCSPEGRAIARRFGRELAEVGISVLSGLALGIDGAAHSGALEAAFGAPPIAVVGNGLDSIYPKRHAQLWDDVRDAGLIIAEAPLGALPEPWRFPARNRILAGLADLVLVIESHERGGSLITVREAAERGKNVMVVPGSVQKPASLGSNRLLSEGCAAALSVDDVLRELKWNVDTGETQPEPVPQLDNQLDEGVLEAIDWSPTSTDEVMLRTGQSLGAVASSLTRLTQLGWVIGGAGWWQRTSPSWS